MILCVQGCERSGTSWATNSLDASLGCQLKAGPPYKHIGGTVEYDDAEVLLVTRNPWAQIDSVRRWVPIPDVTRRHVELLMNRWAGGNLALLRGAGIHVRWEDLVMDYDATAARIADLVGVGRTGSGAITEHLSANEAQRGARFDPSYYRDGDHLAALGEAVQHITRHATNYAPHVMESLRYPLDPTEVWNSVCEPRRFEGEHPTHPQG